MKEHWDLIIKPKRSLFEIDFKAIWRFRDLLRMFVYRDFVTYYRQTILGQIWFFFIQPIFTAKTFLSLVVRRD
jgi:lipopolysaccharide transport system permease protein